MDVLELGNQLKAFILAGDPEGAFDALYHEDVVTVEPSGENPEGHGLAVCRQKKEWFDQTMEVHGATVEGPFPNGNQVALYLSYDVTEKASGMRFNMNEVGLYTFEDGKIVREVFYYHMPGL